MSRIRTVVVTAALSAFGATIAAGLVVALATSVAVDVVPDMETTGAASPRTSSVEGTTAGNPTVHDRAPEHSPGAPPPVAPGDEPADGSTDGGTGGPAAGGGLPPMPTVPLLPPGVAAEITWIGATPYPAMCGGSFTIFADVWDDVGVVSAIAYMEGVGYPMTTNTGTNWYVVVPVPAGAELIGGVAFSVDIRDTDGMGGWRSSQVNVTC